MSLPEQLLPVCGTRVKSICSQLSMTQSTGSVLGPGVPSLLGAAGRASPGVNQCGLEFASSRSKLRHRKQPQFWACLVCE